MKVVFLHSQVVLAIAMVSSMLNTALTFGVLPRTEEPVPGYTPFPVTVAMCTGIMTTINRPEPPSDV